MLFSENLQTLNSILSSDLLINSRYDIVSNFNKLNTYCTELTAGIVQQALVQDVNDGVGEGCLTPENLRSASLVWPLRADFDLITSGGILSSWVPNVKYVQDYFSEQIQVTGDFFPRNANSQPTNNNLFQIGGDGVNENVSFTNRLKAVFATTFYGTATQAQYADLAEMYTCEGNPDPGTLVTISDDKNIELVVTPPNFHDVFGVVSTAPGFLMDSGKKGVPVALAGKVPVKVKGTCIKGAWIIPSNEAGVGKVATDYSDIENMWGCKIRALESKDTEEVGLIMCAIK